MKLLKEYPAILALLFSGIMISWLVLEEEGWRDPVFMVTGLPILLTPAASFVMARRVVKSEKVKIWIARLLQAGAIAWIFHCVVTVPLADMRVTRPNFYPFSFGEFFESLEDSCQHLEVWTQAMFGLICAISALNFRKIKSTIVITALALVLFLCCGRYLCR